MGVFSQDSGVLRWSGGPETIVIEPWGSDSLRVRGTVRGALLDDQPGALLAGQPGDSRIELAEDGARVVNGAITATVTADGRISFTRTSDGTPLLTEPEPHFSAPPVRRYMPVGAGGHRVSVSFEAADGERFYGLGQHQHGKLDNKGAVIELVQRNTEVSVPFLVSSRGYGFLWNHPGVGRVELGTAVTRWVSELSRQWDYWITAAAEPAQILRNYGAATGLPPRFPYWASGFWQCKLRYRNQEELLEVAREFKRRGLPLSVLVIDYFHWSKQGEWRFHPDDWPDPRAMVDELESMGVKLMVSIWPTVNPHSANHDEMAGRGLLVMNEQGQQGQLGFWDRDTEGKVPMSYYDATNPAAREYLWDKVTDGYYRYGIKTWWLDACEPEQRPEDYANLRFHLGNGMEVGTIYPLLHVQGFYEGMRSAGEDEIVLLSRSAWAGSQRYGSLVWSGDVASTFEALRQQVTAGLNMAMSGIGWWTTDIGGFHGGNVSDHNFRELLVRWFQFGVFSPVCRLHGVRQPVTGHGAAETGAPNEPWTFGEQTGAILRDWLELRERLRPYVMSVMEQAHETGLPVIRPLFLGFPGDQACWDIDDQYLFGEDILVAPVTSYGARRRRVYLPPGTTWRDAWTGAEHAGGQWLDAAAPLERIPVFLRDECDTRPFGLIGGQS
jgi:alpha-D-xyloside xylohydrolase